MNVRLAALLTGAHAAGWRRRYGAEFCALLEDLPATPAWEQAGRVLARERPVRGRRRARCGRWGHALLIAP
jgi:hypothetical protein